MTRALLFVALATALSCGSDDTTPTETRTPDRPNILIIVADDFGSESSALYPAVAGSGAVRTPNLEALAARGVVFDNAWATPMCSPTRATILTGLYGNRTGVTNAGDVLPTSTTSLFEYITAKGAARYDMAVVGKWHLGGNQGVQHVRDTGVPYFRGFLGAMVPDYFDWSVVALDGTTTRTTTYATTAITDLALSFLEQHNRSRPGDPWLAYVAYNAPHTPSQVPPPSLHSVNLGGLAQGATANTQAVYQAMIQAMDTEIGRLLAKVDLNSTLVIFAGDNGTPANLKTTGSTVRGGKLSVHEGGVRVPLVIAGAGVSRRGRDSSLVVSTDLFATAGVAAGAPDTQINDSFSLQPLLAAAAAPSGRAYAFTELCQPGVTRYAIRNGRYKLLHDSGSWELYDLATDPREASNLHASPAHAAIRASLELALAGIKAKATSGCLQ